MILRNGNVLLNDEIRKATVVASHGVITRIANDVVKSPKEEIDIDCSGLYVFPGFVDTHIHGAGGGDSCKLTEESYSNIVQSKAAHGSTAIVLAIGGMSDDFVHQSTKYVEKVNSLGTGAKILGLHLEGPWVSRKKRGAIPDAHLADEGNLERAKALVSGYEEYIKIITLAPEINGINDVIRFLTSKGIVVSLGHSDGTYSDADKAIKNGASCFTHLFNAMNPVSGREPGLVGCALTNDNSYCEVIADGFHVHPQNVRLIALAKKERMIAMTDSIEVAGTDCKSFSMPGIGDVFVHDGRTWGPHDSIIGSILTQDQAFRNLITWKTGELIDVARMFSENPCKLLNIFPRKGCISFGSDADFTILDDHFNVVYTIIDGKIVYRRA